MTMTDMGQFESIREWIQYLSTGGDPWCISMESELAVLASRVSCLRLHRTAELLLGDFVVGCRSSCTFGLRYFVESSPVGFRGQYSQAMRYMIFPPLQRSLWCLHAFAQFWLNSDLLPGPIYCGTTVNAKPGSTIEEELAQSNRPGTWPTLFWLGCVAWQVLGMSQKLSCHERCLGQLKASVLSFRACTFVRHLLVSVVVISICMSSVMISTISYQWKLFESHLVHQIIFAQEVWMNLVLEGGVTIRRCLSPCKLMLTIFLKGVEKGTAICWNYLGWSFTINKKKPGATT